MGPTTSGKPPHPILLELLYVLVRPGAQTCRPRLGFGLEDELHRGRIGDILG